MTDKSRLANPNAVINTKVLADITKEPKISDGTKLNIRAGNKKLVHVLALVEKHARKLREEEDFAP
ncbi:4727_t:CDS:2 [Acaulospora morrowiae]|uniref:4727_t:CDS:1 n=1 Tax=Acaulospora morrowiae TaxID=94023 RepID=A0A9N9EK61_9GLOM|nr:4727_t:CDS:2 [Acaulospora morrowiae]